MWKKNPMFIATTKKLWNFVSHIFNLLRGGCFPCWCLKMSFHMKHPQQWPCFPPVTSCNQQQQKGNIKIHINFYLSDCRVVLLVHQSWNLSRSWIFMINNNKAAACHAQAEVPSCYWTESTRAFSAFLLIRWINSLHRAGDTFPMLMNIKKVWNLNFLDHVSK